MRYVLLAVLIASLFAVGSAAAVRPACMDGRDNDGDGLIDLADPGCSAKNDRDESNAPPSSVQPLGPSGSWSIRWEDNFDGTALDTSKWSDSSWGTACTTSVSGGEMVMALRSAVQGHGCQKRSLTSVSGAFAMEARVLAPATDSGQPANHCCFWAHQTGGSTVGEIDLWEFGDCYIHNGDGSNAVIRRLPGQWAGQWHTYTASYENGVVKVWWDGQLVCDTTGINLGWDTSPVVVVFSNFTDPCCNPYQPADMHAEYARVWVR